MKVVDRFLFLLILLLYFDLLVEEASGQLGGGLLNGGLGGLGNGGLLNGGLGGLFGGGGGGGLLNSGGLFSPSTPYQPPYPSSPYSSPYPSSQGYGYPQQPVVQQDPPPQNPCSNSQCNGQGVCEGFQTAFRCYCEVGWMGPTCAIAACNDRINCNDHGTCRAGSTAANPRCDCNYPPWYGVGCKLEDRAREPCNREDCTNHGTCTGTHAFPVCACDPGWLGVRCEQAACNDARDCNGPYGRCGGIMASQNYPDCQCALGYSGTHCKVIDPNIVACDRSDCNNHGNCNGTKANPNCTCDPGWASVQTDQCDAGPCDNSTCSGHGYCVGTSYDYPPQCNCTDVGWIGAACNITDNATLPCSVQANCNNARAPTTCTGTYQQYVCNCANGYRQDPNLGCVVANTDNIQCDPNVDCNGHGTSCNGTLTTTQCHGLCPGGCGCNWCPFCHKSQVPNYSCTCDSVSSGNLCQNSGSSGTAANPNNTACDRDHDCSSHGTCSAGGTQANPGCVCDPGRTGGHCELALWLVTSTASPLAYATMPQYVYATPGYSNWPDPGAVPPLYPYPYPNPPASEQTAHHHHHHHHHREPQTDVSRDCDSSDCSYQGLCSGWQANGAPVCVCNLGFGGDACQLGPAGSGGGVPVGGGGCPQCNFHGSCLNETTTNNPDGTSTVTVTCSCFNGYNGTLCDQSVGPRMARIHWRMGGNNNG